MQGLKSGRFEPDLICFTGGTVRDNRVADASAGYIFFRHLCEQHEVQMMDARTGETGRSAPRTCEQAQWPPERTWNDLPPSNPVLEALVVMNELLVQQRCLLYCSSCVFRYRSSSNCVTSVEVEPDHADRLRATSNSASTHQARIHPK